MAGEAIVHVFVAIVLHGPIKCKYLLGGLQWTEQWMEFMILEKNTPTGRPSHTKRRQPPRDFVMIREHQNLTPPSLKARPRKSIPGRENSRYDDNHVHG